MGDADEEVFFSLEDDVLETSSEPIKPSPELVAKESAEDAVEILDAEIVMQATGDYDLSLIHI